MDGINPGTWLPEDSEYMHMFNASWRALKSVSPRLKIGGPAMANLDGVTEFLHAQPYWGIDADFVTVPLVALLITHASQLFGQMVETCDPAGIFCL